MNSGASMLINRTALMINVRAQSTVIAKMLFNPQNNMVRSGQAHFTDEETEARPFKIHR